MAAVMLFVNEQCMFSKPQKKLTDWKCAMAVGDIHIAVGYENKDVFSSSSYQDCVVSLKHIGFCKQYNVHN